MLGRKTLRDGIRSVPPLPNFVRGFTHNVVSTLSCFLFVNKKRVTFLSNVIAVRSRQTEQSPFRPSLWGFHNYPLFLVLNDVERPERDC